ncbi:MAG: hypothetical protein ACOCQP_00730, partial [Lentisphaeria bacterium]
MKFKLIHDLEDYLQSEYSCEERPVIYAERPPQEFEGDITINCFRLAPHLRRAPQEIAGIVEGFCQQHRDVESARAVKAFVNVIVDSRALFQQTVADMERIWRDVEF